MRKVATELVTTQRPMTWRLVHLCSKLVVVTTTARVATARRLSLQMVTTVTAVGLVLDSMSLGILTFPISRFPRVALMCWAITTCRATTTFQVITACTADHGTDLESRSRMELARTTVSQGFQLQITSSKSEATTMRVELQERDFMRVCSLEIMAAMPQANTQS